ncbi:MAG: hypothetical protein ABI741_14560 [Ferruginibacter sp.]
MKHIIKNISGVLLAAILLTSCDKETGPLTDVLPPVPVLVNNAIAYRPEPTVSTTLAATDSIITIVLSIPASSKRTITAVSKIALSTSYAAIQSTGTTGFYPYGTLTLAGTTATFKTSIREYFLNKPVSASNPAAAANKELANRYYFKVTLDDGSVIYPEPVRVLVL